MVELRASSKMRGSASVAFPWELALEAMDLASQSRGGLHRRTGPFWRSGTEGRRRLRVLGCRGLFDDDAVFEAGTGIVENTCLTRGDNVDKRKPATGKPVAAVESRRLGPGTQLRWLKLPFSIPIGKGKWSGATMRRATDVT